jgi:hypothetical protein
VSHYLRGRTGPNKARTAGADADEPPQAEHPVAGVSDCFEVAPAAGGVRAVGFLTDVEESRSRAIPTWADELQHVPEFVLVH